MGTGGADDGGLGGTIRRAVVGCSEAADRRYVYDGATSGLNHFGDGMATGFGFSGIKQDSLCRARHRPQLLTLLQACS